MMPLRLKINNYKSALKNKQLSAIVENIISSFPLTLISLERIRNEIDKLNIPFWVKDEQGKYLIVNNKFASNFHLTPSQVEGKPVEKFIPEYLVHFSNALQMYIKESGSVITIEGFPWSGTQAGENNRVVEIPVLSPEGNLNAIIGIALENEGDSSGKLLDSLSVLKEFLKNYLLIDNENKIIDAGEDFCITFSLNADELKGKLFKSDFSGIPVIITTMIDEFIDSGEKNKSVNAKIPYLPDYDFKLHFVKGKDDEILLLVEKNIQAKEVESSQLQSFDIENIPEPVFIYDKEDLKFLSANEPALQLYGYRKDEFLNLDLTDLYSPDDIQTLADNPDEGKAASIQHRQKRKDGKNIFVEISKKLISYNDKPAYLNIVRDITGKIAAEKEGKLYNSLFNNSSDLIFITDKDGFIKSVNNSAVTHLNIHEKNLKDISFTSLLIDEDRGKINSALFQSGKKDKFSSETSLKKSSGEVLKVKLNAVPIISFTNEIESINIICSSLEKEVIVKEIFKEIPVELKAQEFSPEIPELNFLSEIFHDILTPINVILGFVQELTENIENPSPEQKESLEIINLNKENLITLLNHIVDFVQYEKGKVKVEQNKIRIIDVIEELKSETESKKIIEELAYGKISSSLEIITDKEKFIRTLVLLVNLISKTTGKKKLFISAEPLDKEYFGICIKDSYNTPSEDFIKKSVELFSNADKIKIQGIPSVTLKLFTSSLNLLQGSFRFLEDKGKPAFIFPINPSEIIVEDSPVKSIESEPAKVREQVTEEVTDIPSEEIKRERDKTQIDISQLSCLYIEDQIDSQLLFSMQMKELKEIHFAVSLEQAIPLLKKNKYDFIIVDINLQGDYNGLDILKIVRTMPELETIPVIAVTAYQLPSDREIYIQAGFTDFISKPLLKENLINSLQRTLELQV